MNWLLIHYILCALWFVAGFVWGRNYESMRLLKRLRKVDATEVNPS